MTGATLSVLLSFVQAAIPPSTELRFGYVDLELVVQTCSEGKLALSGLKVFVDATRIDLERQSQGLDALKAKLVAQRDKLTDEARVELEDEIDAKETTLRRAQEDSQKETEKRRARAVDRVAKRAATLIEKLAKERGFSAVFYRSQVDLWVDPAADLTAEIIKAYDRVYPAPSPQTR